MSGTDQKFSERETQKRLEAALRGAFKTFPTPMKSLPRKRKERKSKALAGHKK